MIVRLSVFALCALVLAAAALSTGAAVYYMLLFTMLMMMAVGLVSSLVALYTVTAKLSVPHKKLTRGQGAPLSIKVRYVSVLPVRSVQLVLLVPEDERATETMDVQLPPLTEREFTFRLPCPHRGLYHVGLDAVVVTDIFQLFRFKRRLRGASQLLEVRPAVTELPAMELRSGESEPNILTRSTEDTASPSDTRNYRSGDPLKRIHWKLSMRKRELMVRTFEESAKPDTLILTDLSPLSTLRSQALATQDMICECAASIALAQLKAGYPVRMPLMSERPMEPSGKSAMEFNRFLDALMRVPFDSPYPYEQVLMLEMRRMQRTGGAVLITSRLTPRTCDVAQQLRRFGMQVAVCWITDTRRAEAMEMLDRLSLMGIQAHKIDPYDKGIAVLADLASAPIIP